MFDIHVLGSSSSGNCIYVNTGDCRFLLDVGLSYTMTKKMLFELDVGFSDIDYIFITHEHIDHIRALDNIIKNYDIKIIASKGTLHKKRNFISNNIYIKDSQTIYLEDIKVSAKKVNHNANEPLCFSIENSMGEKLLYLTDCGMAKYLRFENHNVYIIEANYSSELLTKNFNNKTLCKVRYERAISGMGHLNIEQTIGFLSNNIGSKTSNIILTHLSSDNADKELFKQKTIDELFFFNVEIAKEGLHIKCGDNPCPF